MTPNSQPSKIPTMLMMLVGVFVVFALIVVVNKPDRPVPTIVPGSSSEPTFVVQIIRPRMGLPLGGILPPELFDLEEHLGFDSSSPGASIGDVGYERLELSSDDWNLVIVRDGEGRVTSETHVVFDLLFEERPRRVRCRPDDYAIGSFSTTKLSDSTDLSGNFDIEVAHCEDAEAGTPLGWPPQPLILHGSFDRLPLDSSVK
ncbi:MAG: hypothetical protein ACI8TQ_004027 [Planctomycetota bacterium]|jgi:hypothetical protein